MKHSLCATGESSQEIYALWHGIKICKDKATNTIIIYNTTLGGNYYAEINPNEYKAFMEEGWKTGVYFVASLNYRRKLEVINKRIKDLVNKPSSTDKKYRQLKESRSRYIKLLTNTIIHLTKIKSNENY
ncbi:MAG: hypothetical protein ACTSQA_02150 [Candidatus Heimdallarchaeaceae archaeon]